VFFDSALLESIPRFATPVLLAAMGSALCERAGVFNIALEGMMLIGAFAAIVGSFYTGSWVGGLGFAMMAGVLTGLLFFFFGVRRNGDDIIVSIGLNVLAVGLTAFLLRSLFDVSGQFDDSNIVAIPKIHLGLIADVPILGHIVSGQSILVWFAVVAAFCIHYILYKHVMGLRLRSAGQNPAALLSVGLSPERVKMGALIACGVLCGLAGAQLSISNVTLFTEGMSAGRGWIAYDDVRCPFVVYPSHYHFIWAGGRTGVQNAGVRSAATSHRGITLCASDRCSHVCVSQTHRFSTLVKEQSTDDTHRI